MTNHDNENAHFLVSGRDLIEQVRSIDDVEQDARRGIIEDRSLALGAILNHIALIKAGLVESDMPEEELYKTAAYLLKELGIKALLASSVPEPVDLETPVTNEDMIAFGKEIRAQRKSKGLSQAEFGELYGVSRDAVGRAERGQGTKIQTALKGSLILNSDAV